MLAPSKHTNALAVEDAMLRELPNGWAMTTLGEACLINPPFFIEPVEDDLELSFLPMAAVEAGTGRIDLSRTRLFTDVRKGYTRFSEGDVLFAKITPCMENGKIAVAKGLTNNCGCGSTEFHVLRPHKGVTGNFLLFFLLQDTFRREAQGHMAGTAGQLRVPTGFLEEALLPLPPLPEQHRIVEEIEKQFTRLDASVAALKRVQANLKRYRASVLKAACEGKLVPTEAELARSEGREYEQADRVLERVLAERRAYWESQEKRRGRYKGPVEPDTSALPEIPEGWMWATVGQLSSRIEYGTSTKASSVPTGIPVLRMGNIQNGELNFSDLKYLEADSSEIQKTMLSHGDLLFNRTNSAELVGKSAVYKDRYPKACFASYLIRVSFLSDISPDYVCTFINSRHGRAYIAQVRNQQVGQANVNGTKLAAMPIPLPPLTEQCRIVAEVERRLSVVQQTEAAVEANLTRAERLCQSILKQAFSGKLIPQDPNDEPASVLLERIRAERGAAQASAKLKSRAKRRRPRSSPERQLVLGVQEKSS